MYFHHCLELEGILWQPKSRLQILIIKRERQRAKIQVRDFCTCGFGSFNRNFHNLSAGLNWRFGSEVKNIFVNFESLIRLPFIQCLGRERYVFPKQHFGEEGSRPVDHLVWKASTMTSPNDGDEVARTMLFLFDA